LKNDIAWTYPEFSRNFHKISLPKFL